MKTRCFAWTQTIGGVPSELVYVLRRAPDMPEGWYLVEVDRSGGRLCMHEDNLRAATATTSAYIRGRNEKEEREIARAVALLEMHGVPDARRQRIEWERQGIYGPEV